MLAGRGYYSELLSYTVGDSGKVIIHNDPRGHSFYDAVLNARLKDLEKLASTVRMDVDINDITFEENSIDTVFLILSYHDFYFHIDAHEETKVKLLLAKLKKAVKPGEVIGIIDHDASAGSAHRVAGNLTPNRPGSDHG